jgi:2-polyprenyl-3-methyl-5-hydroxy-6-metoxy-1,4-benzoquinol methylase
MICVACAAEFDVKQIRTAGTTTWAVCPVCGLMADIAYPPDYGQVWYAADKGTLPTDWKYDPTEPKIARVLAGNVGPWRQMLLSLNRPGGILLDVGCGAGEVLDYARELGYWSRVVGTEINRHFVAFTRSRGHEVHYTDLVHHPIEDLLGHVSLAICNEVLEHVPDPVALLRAIGPYLHPSGALFASFATIPQFPDPGEGYYWTQAAVLQAVLRAGLSLISCRQTAWRFDCFCRRKP